MDKPHDPAVDRPLAGAEESAAQGSTASEEPRAVERPTPHPEPATTVPPPPKDPAPVTHAAPPSPYTKTPGLAAFLSAVPGLGNIYNGLYLRGIAFFLTYVALFSLTIQAGDRRDTEGELAFLIPSLFFFWCFNIFDAYRQAMLINYAETYKDPAATKRMPASGGLVAGGIVFAVGLYGALYKYLDIDLAWIVQLWPLALMTLGAYLIWEHFKNKPPVEDSLEF